jgi:hypothetical protein
MITGTRLYALRFRFKDAEDVAAYGDGWHAWDEPAVTRLRGRELIALEELVDGKLVDIIRGLREEKTLATMQAMWIGLHREGQAVAWEDFNPVVIGPDGPDWEKVPEPEAPLDPGAAALPEPSSSAKPTTESATS